MKKRILLIQTGGTISMKIEKESGIVCIDKDSNTPPIINQLPELQTIAKIETITCFNEDSSNLTPSHWIEIAKTVQKQYPKFDGFVILHGTDTMAYTASALSFCFHNLDKPIILTGSQVPLINIRSDARRNLINSVEVATLPLNEVAICFNDHVFRGNRSTKMSIGDFDAFASPNYPPIAKIGLHIETNFSYTATKEIFSVKPNFDTNIAIIKLFPGIESVNLNAMLTQNIKAIIIESYGSGNIPVTHASSIIPLLKTCQSKNIIVLIISQAPHDSVDLNKYENGRIAAKLGAISGKDMTAEASVTKLMYLLGNYTDVKEIKQLLSSPLKGEMAT